MLTQRSSSQMMNKDENAFNRADSDYNINTDRFGTSVKSVTNSSYFVDHMKQATGQDNFYQTVSSPLLTNKWNNRYYSSGCFGNSKERHKT